MFGKSDFLANVLKLGGGTALGQAVVVLATPLLTRLYSPEDMGLLGLFVAFVGTLSVATGLRYEMAIVSAKNDQEAEGLLAASIRMALPVSLLAGLLMLGLIHLQVMSYDMLPSWSALLAIPVLLATGVFTALRYWFVRQSDFTDIGRALVAQGIGRAFVPITLGWLSVGWVGLLAGEIAGRLLGIGRLLRNTGPALRRGMLFLKGSNGTSLLKQHWKFPALLLPSSLLDALAAMLPLPIISSLFGSASAGEFLLVQRLGALPAGLISGAVADVFHARISDAQRDTPSEVRAILLNTVKKLAISAGLIYVPIALVSPFLFGPLFGERWAAAGTLMAILAPVYLAGLVASPVSRLLLVTNRVELKLIFDVISVAAPLLAFYGMHRMAYGFLSCVAVYSGLAVFSYLLYLGLIWRATRAETT